jgi:hypothetical protein
MSSGKRIHENEYLRDRQSTTSFACCIIPPIFTLGSKKGITNGSLKKTLGEIVARVETEEIKVLAIVNHGDPSYQSMRADFLKSCSISVNPGGLRQLFLSEMIIAFQSETSFIWSTRSDHAS